MDEHERAAGERRERIQGSANFEEGVAQNPVPTRRMDRVFDPKLLSTMLKTTAEYLRPVERVPKAPPPVERPDVLRIAAREAGLRITWLGHSSLLVAIDGALFLTDPVFSKRASPVQWAGPARFHRPPLALDELPPLDGVVLSHDHFDHLDEAAVRTLAQTGVRFFTPLGVGGHLARFGIPPAQVSELDWLDRVEVAGVELHLAPARHFSGRSASGGNRTLWGSWAFIGPHHKAWFSGDTGPFDDGVRAIGERFGAFDIAMIETGAWHPSWGDIHLGPQQAVRMHQLVGARSYLPVHWGTFNLALHAWDDPILHVQELAHAAGVAVHAPIAGGTVHADQPIIHATWRERWARWRQEAPDEAALMVLPT
jgi:L-ascorbate metabolism protein UlaG (beta-lactamase superfamily)